MNGFKKTVCMVLVCAFCAVPVHAKTKAAAYKETALSIPGGLTAADEIMDLSVRGDQIDLITERQIQKPNDTFLLRQIHSDDGGKTWKDADISWLNTLQGESNWQPWAAMREDGTIYALLGEDKRVERPEVVYNYYVNTIVAHKDGVTRTVCRLDNRDYIWHLPVQDSLSQEGDIILVAEGQRIEELPNSPAPSRLMTIDAATGEIRTSVEIPNDGRGGFQGSVNGDAVKMEVDTTEILDTATGRVKQRIKTLQSPEGTFGSASVCAGGAIYGLNASGLFRFRPGEQGWTRLMDKSVCKQGTGGSEYANCKALAVDQDGNIYALRMHYNLNQYMDQELKAWTFSRYTPAES